jgi:hypothetical protein
VACSSECPASPETVGAVCDFGERSCTIGLASELEPGACNIDPVAFCGAAKWAPSSLSEEEVAVDCRAGRDVRAAAVADARSGASSGCRDALGESVIGPAVPRCPNRTARAVVAAHTASSVPAPWTKVASRASQPRAKPGGSQAETRDRGPASSRFRLATTRWCPRSWTGWGRQADTYGLL